jgi:hypothetical protein
MAKTIMANNQPAMYQRQRRNGEISGGSGSGVWLAVSGLLKTKRISIISGNIWLTSANQRLKK